jgi:hypothetical protein
MLADPKLQLTVQDLIAWLETKDADQCYPYFDRKHCMMAQFCQRIGVDYIKAIDAKTLEEQKLRMKFEHIGAGDGFVEDWNFGDALKRARNAL